MAGPISKKEGAGINCLQRAAYIDVAKGLLIVLVVVGHVWQAVYNNDILNDEKVYHLVNDWIYSFHMPAFFFLSGLFALHSAQRPVGDFILRKCRTIAYPYLLWSVLQSSMQLLMKGSTTNALSFIDILKIPIYPQMQFWFLYALFFIFLLFILLKQLTSSRVIFLGVGVLLFVVFQLGYGSGSAALTYLSRYFIFFSMGIFCSPFILLYKMKTMPKRSTLLFSALLLLFFSLIIPHSQGVSHSLVNAWEGPLVALPGIFLVLSVALFLFSTSKVLSGMFIYLGKRSLEIFVAHTIFAAGFRITALRIAGVDSVSIHILAGTAAGLLGPLFLVYFSKRFGFRYLFTWPSRTKLKKGDSDAEHSSF